MYNIDFHDILNSTTIFRKVKIQKPMNEALFSGDSVRSNRILYTPSPFAKDYLAYLQEVGALQATKPHTSQRQGLKSFLFFIVNDGKGHLIYQGKEYPLKKGDCVFIDCRNSYSHTPDSEHLWSLQWAHFYGVSLPGIYDKYLERGGHPVFSPRDPAPYSDLLNQLLSVASSKDYILDMKINEKISGLLTLIMSESWHPETAPKPGLKKQSLSEIKDYLEEHSTEKISLDDLADRFYINKYYMTRMFKEQFGTTILSYVDHIRVSRAKHLLRFTNQTLEEIGHAVGIDEPGYFNRVFKKVEGVSPGEYRKLW